MAENKKRVSIGLTDKQYELVEKLAKEKGFSKSAIFVLALEEYSRKESEQKNKWGLIPFKKYEFSLMLVLSRRL